MNSENNKPPQNATPWAELREFTAARIALGRTGSSLPTTALLQFGFAHAQARDAVHAALDTETLTAELTANKFLTATVNSCAADRNTYLKRPDLGRQLNATAKASLAEKFNPKQKNNDSICIVVADGLSAIAVQNHALPLLHELRQQWPQNWPEIPIIIATQARVALGDAIAETLNAKLVIVLIGERPGLSSPDSLGVYLTYSPRIGRTDAERNCISNIRPQGLSYASAAHKIKWLSENALLRQISGVNLKDDSDTLLIPSL